MKDVKVKFVDYWEGHDPNEDMITKILWERYNVVLSDSPDYVFYGPFGEEHLKYRNAIKIFITGENVRPNFNLCDYAIGFDEMEFGDRYLRFPGWLKCDPSQLTSDDTLANSVAKKHIGITDDLCKREFCSFVYSNKYADSNRKKLFDEISHYKKVDSAGRYLNNINKPIGIENKLEFEMKHKFSIACENSSINGYHTEKLLQSFQAKTVPIYWGDPTIASYFNSGSFINCMDYDDINEVVNKIIEIDNDDELYLKMLRTPAFIEGRYNQMDEVLKLKDFLYHIFSANKKDAYRRCDQVFEHIYYDEMVEKERLYQMLLHKIPRKIKNVLERRRRL